MVRKRWTKGQTRDAREQNFFDEFPAGTVATELKINDTEEIFEFDDELLDTAQKGRLTGKLNADGWTDVSP